MHHLQKIKYLKKIERETSTSACGASINQNKKERKREILQLKNFKHKNSPFASIVRKTS
jgi:hypothetical protein